MRNSKYCYGGTLRNKKAGRGQRPLSVKHPIHVVLKANRLRLKSKSLKTYANFYKITKVLRVYAIHFDISLEHFAIEGNHIHLLIRAGRRSQHQYYFRVVAGQIAQRLQMEVTDTPIRGTKLWIQRPYTVIVGNPRYRRTVRNYIQLNVKEASGQIPYKKDRLRGLSPEEWDLLWA